VNAFFFLKGNIFQYLPRFLANFAWKRGREKKLCVFQMETVAVLGLGRLGLCFAVVLEQAGYKVKNLHLYCCAMQRAVRKTV